MHENSLGFNISLSANPLKDHNPSFLEKSPEPYYSIPLDYNEEDDDFWTKINVDLQANQIDLIAYKSLQNEVILIIDNNHFLPMLKLLEELLE